MSSVSSRPCASRSLLSALVLACGSLALMAPKVSADPAAESLYVIFDASGSMWGQLSDGKHKIEAAREALAQLAAGDFGDREVALRVYGHRREGDCADTELVVPFTGAEQAVERIRAFVGEVNPKGKTPISRSLEAALEDFGERSGEILLISDGIETCDADPCDLVRSWAEKNVAIRVHVVGLGLNDLERRAMECIAAAAGTEYQDAGSAAELASSLSRVQEAVGQPALLIRAQTADGADSKVRGRLLAADGTVVAEVASHRRNGVPAGDYRLEVGIETQRGTLYRPVSVPVTVAPRGETVVRVEVAAPPSVQASFQSQGEAVRGSNITAFQDGQEVFSFRWLDRVYLEAGTYTFKTRIAKVSDEDLTVTATIADGEHKEIGFQVAHTVHARIRMVAAGSGILLRQNYELWRDGALIKGIHQNNGVHAPPGVYDVRLPSELTPYLHRGLVLADTETQELVVEVPVGHLTVIYQSADGTRQQDERVFISRVEGGKEVGGKTITAGTRVPLTAGTYVLEGWSRMGTFDPVTFEIVVGEEREVILRSKS